VSRSFRGARSASPESIATIVEGRARSLFCRFRDYGFRAPAFGRPRNDSPSGGSAKRDPPITTNAAQYASLLLRRTGYVAEFQFRYNNRENADIFGTAISGC